MSATIEQASKKAGDVEQKLKAGKPFLAGDEPGPQDAQAFQELFGSNMHVARWAKHMASFTALERASWKATAPQTQVRSSFSSEAAAEKPAGKPAAAPAAKAEKPAIEPERTEKRDFLRDLETRVQARWEAEKVFEVDPPGPGEEDNGKFLATFPYPYMNGKLHLGHCFSVLKAEFAVAYQRLQGKRALFPFGLHCTGMPIQAAAYKLRSDYEAFGSPYPVFPCGKPQVAMVSESEVDVAFMPPTSTAHDMITGFKIEQKIDQGEWTPISVHLKNKSEKTESDVTLPMQAGPSKALNFSVEGLPTGSEVSFRVTANLEGDRKTTPTGASSDPVALKAKKPEVEGKAKDAGKKKPAAKIVAKTGSALRQWDIMIGMGLSEEEIPAFVDPSKWLDYFPPLGRDDLKMLGVHADFRRTFITTPANPYYDAFVRWQFNKLRAGNYLAFGKRPTVYSEIDQQACMDHDRAEGEGVGHTEYTAIKVKLVEPYPKAVENLKATGKPVYLLCATLRPETMIGQTNCWILPEGKYGVFERNNELVVCSERSARNMSFQDLFPAWGKPVKVQDVTGAELMGASLAAPRAPYKIIHLLPLLTIKMNKGTGIVTSVPADSPDDYAAFKELKNEKKREFYGVKAEWVEPFNVVPIIDVKIDGENRSCSAEYMCEKLGVQSQKDAEKLRQAHDVCYTLGFYE
ncbi:Leucine--tRNA ligase, partial [Diplonema papillatum]|eukprot:gene14211-21792_t